MKVNRQTKKNLPLLPFLWRGLGGGLLLIALAGCPGTSPVDDPDNTNDPNNPAKPEEKVEYVMQDVKMTGLVKDAGGNPLSGVTVTTGTLNATTGSDGKFSFTQAGTVDSRAVVKFEKSGYFTQTRSGDKANEMYIEAMLYCKGNDSISLQTDFDAAKEKTLQLRGITINLPAGCMAKADGSAYSGTVRADVLYLTPVNETTSQLMPGGNLATDKSDEMMLPVGMVDVVFTDNVGNPLEIKDKTNIPISFPAPASATDATVPLWTFDEAKGIWKAEGSVTKQGNVYTGTVSHFTTHGAGKSVKTITVGAFVTKCDKPESNVWVTLWTTGYTCLGFGNTGSGGECLLKAPANVPLTITASIIGEVQQTEIPASNFGKQIVSFQFNRDCEGEGYITFDLIGESSNSFCIKCTPAMPEPNSGTKRVMPHYFLGDGVGAARWAFIFTQANGNPYSNDVRITSSNWNGDFTKCTYIVEKVVPSEPCEGYIAMKALNSLASNKDFLQALNIKSVTIGSNNPVGIYLP